MGPSVFGRTKNDQCPVCSGPYRDERMVECTQCKKWCCYECVNIQDDSKVSSNDSWKCPLCESKKKSTKSTTKNKKSSKKSAISKMRLQLLEEERSLIRKEIELSRESRRILEEDQESDDSQAIDEEEIRKCDPLANEMLSLHINQPSLNNIPHLASTSGKPIQAYGGERSGMSFGTRRIPGELPFFNGNPYDWPIFISSYERSTELCGVDNHENLLRLQKSLKGAAKASVSSFLILPQCVPQIISTLKILYGRPEQIIEAHINAIRRQPPPKAEKLETLVEFSLGVKNLCVSLEATNLKDYLNNPTLLHELLDKLPSQIKVNWALYRSTVHDFKGLSEFADWLYNLAINVCSALPSLALCDNNKNRYFSNERSNVHDSNSTEIPNCKICQKHCSRIAICPEFQKYSIPKRWESVKKLNLCRLCLKRHIFPCKYPVKCSKDDCQRKHHPLLHENIAKNYSPSENLNLENTNKNSNPESHHVTISTECMSQVFNNGIRFRIVPVVLRNENIKVNTFAFLDEGSSITLLDQDIAEKLKLRGNPEQLCLKWTGNQERLEEQSEKVQLSIAGDYPGAKQFDYRPARTISTLSLPTQSLNAEEIKETFSYLQNLPFRSYENAKPQILIGLDNWDLALPIRVKEGLESQPIGAKCRLGWTIFALFSNNNHCEDNFSYHICECNSNNNNENNVRNQELFNVVKEYFSVESLGIQSSKTSVSKELQRASNLQEKTLIQKGNQYQIGLLWKYDHLKLPDSKPMALQRLECIEKRIKKNPELGEKMNKQIEDFLEKKYIRKLSEKEILEPKQKVWYLPIFPVFNSKKPDKFRIVWDAAATVQGISLNTMLLPGDDQLSSLLGVLLRFRERKIGFSGDIKEMFLRVGVIDEDQHAQRFLWRNGSSENLLKTYVMNVMTFGATCSPSCAQFVKNTNAKKFSVQYPRAVESIVKNHYVDDLLDSADSEEEAIKIASEVRQIHAKGNFEIRNWRSNSKEFMESMNNEVKNNLEVNLHLGNDKKSEKVLGMWWNLKTDCFKFNLNFIKGKEDVLNGKRKPTKREVLIILMSIYDPLGLISNFLIYLKMLLQEIWRSKISWDEPISDKQYKKWFIWLKYLPKIEEISIPRCYLTNIRDWKDTIVQMHIFVDASEHASSCVAYLRIEQKETTECVLIGSKTRVAPIKLQTIPRLELDGAVIGARLAKNICQYLSIKIDDIFYWSDSIIVLHWIRNEDPRKLTKYVAYRVAEIQENSVVANWRYVPTQMNVADEATKWKGQPNVKITDRWFKGPEFLYKSKEVWPPDTSLKQEEKCNHTIETNIVCSTLIQFDRFSKFKRLLRATAYVLRAADIFKSKLKKEEIKFEILTADELLRARNTLIKQTQFENYGNEMKQLQNKKNNSDLQSTVKKSSSLFKLSPYLDENDLLRIRGRIEKATDVRFDTKRPIILPRGSRLALLIVEDYHQIYQHRNHESVVNEIRQTFYIPKLRRFLNKIRHDCNYCKIKFALPKTPEMSPLPECRLATFTAPFTHTGVDYFGPINVTVRRRTEKRWGALFTCLTTRAVHLEIAYKLNVDSCILCFTKFMNRRGRPRHIYCDRGTNFIATERILREELRNVDSKLIANSLVSPQIMFHFNAPLSPHMGGAWERLVKAVKISLYSALPTRTPTDELLYSCLISTENIVNSRPLTYLSLDSEESEALTPNHFLTGSSNGDKPIGELSDDIKVLKSNYLYREQFANKCWQRFVSEYIPDLLLRPKWQKQIIPIKVGDIVVICDKDLPRCNWPKGKVIEIKKAADGQVRKATVQTQQGIFERPVVKLAVIQINEKGTVSFSD